LKKKIIIISCLLLLGGCYDRSEIEERAFVIATGIDKGETPDQIIVTFQIANPQAGVEKGPGKDEEPAEIITFPAPDFLTAKDLANSSVARKITFSHMGVFVVSEELARTDTFLQTLKSSIRERELRRHTYLIVSREKASDYIRGIDPKLETRPHKFYDLMSGRWRDTGLVPHSRLHEYFLRSETNMDSFLSIYATNENFEKKYIAEDEYLPGEIELYGGNPTQMIGSAVFKNGIMIGSLNGEETRMTLSLRPKAEAEIMLVTFPDPLDTGYKLSIRFIKQERTKIMFNKDKNPLQINVNVPINLDILAVPSGVDYITDIEKQKLLKEYLTELIEDKLIELVERTQDEFEINPFNWSSQFRREFITLDQLDAFNWRQSYPNADVKITVDLSISGFGKSLQPPPIEKIKEGKRG
jgi:spore germination protein KC